MSTVFGGRPWMMGAVVAAILAIGAVIWRYAEDPLLLRTEVVITNLQVPWAIAFAPDGRIFITERAGRIRIVRDGRLEPEPWAVMDVWQPAVRRHHAGLLGLTLDPEFVHNRLVYVYLTYKASHDTWNRVVRLIDRDGRGVVDRVILDRIHGDALHDGGRILFGPDALLYIGTGEADKSERAQDPTSLAGNLDGCMLRITVQGLAMKST